MLTDLTIVLTDIGGTEATLLICAVIAAALYAIRERAALLALVVAVGTTQLVVAAMKDVIARPRPPEADALIQVGGHAFPSGHSATAAALYGTLALLALSRLGGRARLLALGTAGAMVVGIGLTRIYLGVHYPTDVLAGWAVGAAIALGAWQLGAVVGRQVQPAAA